MRRPSLLDRVLDPTALRLAWFQVERNDGAAGGDGVSLERFGFRLDANLVALADEVREGRYRPGLARRVLIQTGAKWRALDILPIRDRVLQRAVLDAIEPSLDRGFLPSSFGYRPGRGVHDAVARIAELRDEGARWVVDADITDCFGSLNHRMMNEFVANVVPDEGIRRLIGGWLGESPRGILLGAPISPLLCNVYLHHLDARLRRRGLPVVRYADDFVVLCESQTHAELALRATEKVLSGLELRLSARKTRVVGFHEGFEFLGVRFEGDTVAYEVDGTRVVWGGGPPPAIDLPEGYR